MPERLVQTDRTRLRRAPKRGSFDREAIDAILDAMPMCHVGCVVDGSPFVLPTFQWREGDHVYWHGSRAGRSLRAAEGAEVCMTVSLLDGFVLARSGMHHSTNYRSVMIFGRPTVIDDPAEKAARLDAFIERLYPGRVAMLRPMTESEAKATTVLSLPITEVSAKCRTGGPIDDEADYDVPVWAGVIPVRMTIGEPEPDPRNLPGVPVPDHVGGFKIG